MEVLIERIDNFGRGLGYVDGKVCFVPNALPGEVVDVEITHSNKKYIHPMYLRDPAKEKKYHWNYCIVFEDEIIEYNDYIKKHPLSRPIGTVNTVYLDKNTLSIVEEVQL